MTFAPTAEGQGKFTPSIGATFTQRYEGNLLGTPADRGEPQRDWVTTVGPMAEMRYRSEILEFDAQYELTGERYQERSELNRLISRHNAAADLLYRPAPRFAVGFTGSLAETYTPLELGVAGTLVLRRAYARRITIAPTLSYAITPTWNISGHYGFNEEVFGTADPAFIYTTGVGVSRRADARTNYRVDYQLGRYVQPNGEPETSHAGTFTWERAVSPFVTIELGGGPRILDGSIRPEASLIVRQRMLRGDLTFSAGQTDASILGEGAIMRQQRASIEATYAVARYVSISAAPVIFRNARDDRYAWIHGVEGGLEAQLARGVTLSVNGLMGRQRGNLGGLLERIPYYSFGTTLRVLVPGSPRQSPLERQRELADRDQARREGGSSDAE